MLVAVIAWTVVCIVSSAEFVLPPSLLATSPTVLMGIRCGAPTAAFLIAAVTAYLITRRRVMFAAIAYGVLFPVFMAGWTLVILFCGGAIGPCNTHDPSVGYWMAWTIVPGVITSVVLGVVTRSWLVAAASVVAGSCVLFWQVNSLTSQNNVMEAMLSSQVGILWNAIVAGGLLVWAVRSPRLVRQSASACVSCGYDLIGNVSGICPECGAPFQAANAESRS